MTTPIQKPSLAAVAIATLQGGAAAGRPLAPVTAVAPGAAVRGSGNGVRGAMASGSPTAALPRGSLVNILA